MYKVYCWRMRKTCNPNHTVVVTLLVCGLNQKQKVQPVVRLDVSLALYHVFTLLCLFTLCCANTLPKPSPPKTTLFDKPSCTTTLPRLSATDNRYYNVASTLNQRLAFNVVGRCPPIELTEARLKHHFQR